MRRAVGKQPKKRVSMTASVQAPTGGLNAKDPIANMKETEAVIMENWFPTPSSVDVRSGYSAHVTGMGLVESLMIYNNGASEKLFGASAGSVYDCTSAGAVGAAVQTGFTNSRFQNIIMGTAGGSFLMMVNGADKLRGYTGSAWWTDGDGTRDITGVDTRTIIGINNFKNRVWLIQDNSMLAWYLPVSSLGGAANSFDLAGLFKLGGYIMAMCNWTIDNAAGIDDYAVFITSEGEVALYKGTDPSSAATWALVGTFRMGKPIGRRCFTKAGADVLVLTSDGAFPLSKSLLTDRSQLSLAATDKISNLINADIIAYGDNYGWQPFLHPIGNKLLINVPATESLVAKQYVMNTTHGAWTLFTGWNAFCWEELNDVLYFGGTNGVFIADSGQTDNGSDINTRCQQAYSYFRSRGQVKKFQMVRPIFVTNGEINPAVLVNVDYATNRTTVSPSFTAGGSSFWDVSYWDVSYWASGSNIQKKWQSVSGVGYAAGLNVSTASQNLTCQWQATDFVFEPGGVL